MQLPECFPHTRREQYLMVMPEALLSDSEAATKQRLDIRLRYYMRGFLLPLVEEAVARGLTLEEWAVEFVESRYGTAPRAFTR